MNKKNATYPIPPTNEAFNSLEEIEVPILTHTLYDEEKRAQEQAINFNERMRVLDYYIEDCSKSEFWNRHGNPWHVVWISKRYASGNPYHFYCGWHYASREEALDVAKLANWFKYDDKAIDAILAQGRFDKYYLYCEIDGAYGRDYWIKRLHSEWGENGFKKRNPK